MRSTTAASPATARGGGGGCFTSLTHLLCRPVANPQGSKGPHTPSTLVGPARQASWVQLSATAPPPHPLSAARPLTEMQPRHSCPEQQATHLQLLPLRARVPVRLLLWPTDRTLCCCGHGLHAWSRWLGRAAALAGLQLGTPVCATLLVGAVSALGSGAGTRILGWHALRQAHAGLLCRRFFPDAPRVPVRSCELQPHCGVHMSSGLAGHQSVLRGARHHCCLLEARFGRDPLAWTPCWLPLLLSWVGLFIFAVGPYTSLPFLMWYPYDLPVPSSALGEVTCRRCRGCACTHQALQGTPSSSLLLLQGWDPNPLAC
jgi:hypothetical protein